MVLAICLRTVTRAAGREQSVTAALTSSAAPSVALGSVPLWDTAWTLSLARRSTIQTYLAARRRQGFDVVLCGYGDFDTRNTPLGNGQRPFLASLSTPRGSPVADVLRPNGAGWAFVDATISYAAGLGLIVALVPLGNSNETHYADALTDQTSGENRAYRYGLWLGTRYKNTPNLIWVVGSDVNPSYGDDVTLTNNFAAGIRAAGDTHLMTFETDGTNPSSSTFFHRQAWLGFNGIQIKPFSASAITTDLGLTPAKPTGILETQYETSAYSKGATSEQILSWAWRAYLAGASYMTYGQARMYQGQNPAPTNGIRYSRIARDMVVARGWRSYTPTSDFIASSRGAITSMRKANTAAMIYLGSGASVAVKMDYLNATGRVRAQRVDPRTGHDRSLGVFATSGTQTFTGGGLTDAVILLDAVTP